MSPSQEEISLAALSAPYVLLEDRSVPGESARLFTDPVEILCAEGQDEVEHVLARLGAGLARGLHAAGWLSYELGYLFEPRLLPLLPGGRRLPLIWLGLFAAPRSVAPAALDQAFAARGAPPPLAGLEFGLSAPEHARDVARVLDYLRAGDAYQVNLTFPIRFRYGGDPLALYAALRAAQPAAHGGLVATGDATILSVSPELFVETRGRVATTRPMKGTVARGPDAASDEAARAALLADPKQRAENLMIVDLLRNDLGRIAQTASVAVPELFTVETYPTLHTLTSTVTARLRADAGPAELIRAMFPCGSVTGAPKLRAMEIIRELEPAPRDVYTGSLGSIAPNGELGFNVAIRTATLLPGGEGVYGVGGGIVADSQAESEYAECRLKARVLTDLAEDYGLFETLRWTRDEGYRHRDLHLARLGASAALLGFAFAPETATALLDVEAERFADGGDRRVRLDLRRDGALTVTAVPMPPEPEDALLLCVAARPVDPGDPFLRHKTTRRGRYEQAFAEAVTRGCGDALLCDRDGFLTETTRANLFLPRDGLLLTPPLARGLLPGILRRHLLDTGRAREADLRLDELRGAWDWFVGNSLRGLRRARLSEG